MIDQRCWIQAVNFHDVVDVTGHWVGRATICAQQITGRLRFRNRYNIGDSSLALLHLKFGIPFRLNQASM